MFDIGLKVAMAFLFALIVTLCTYVGNSMRTDNLLKEECKDKCKPYTYIYHEGICFCNSVEGFKEVK